jgi:hypothetical protein
MKDNPNLPEGDENVKLENEFLKMKLMLEQGAQFGSANGNNSDLPAEIENQFLHNIIEFEKQYAEQKRIKLFDKIGRPGQFKPVKKIPANEMDNAWDELNEYLHKFDIDLTVCSPHVSCKELYRFVVEELFKYEMDDMSMPGMMHCFTYDDFHPDYEYENTNAAIDDCIKIMLSKRPMEWMSHFRNEDIRLNKHFPITEEEFKKIVNRFKVSYEEIELKEITNINCSISGSNCKVRGGYELTAKTTTETIPLKGTWMVEFKFFKDMGYWYIINVQVTGINF